MIRKKDLITGIVDMAQQLQSHGFDLTAKEVFIFKAGKIPTIGFKNKYREYPLRSKVPLTEYNYWFLREGTYLVGMNEEVNLPDTLKARSIARSSLSRLDCCIDTINWEAGYSGKSMHRLTVGKNGLRLYRDARVVQIMFVVVEKAEKPYDR